MSGWALAVGVVLVAILAALAGLQRMRRASAPYEREREARGTQHRAFVASLAARWQTEAAEGGVRAFASTVRGRRVRVTSESRRWHEAVWLTVECAGPPLRVDETVSGMLLGRSQEDVFLAVDAGTAAVLGATRRWVLWGRGAGTRGRVEALPEAWLRWLDTQADLDARCPGVTFARGEVRVPLAGTSIEELDAKVGALCAAAEGAEATLA